MARGGRRDAGLLYLAQALGENPNAGANELIRGLKERGLSYRRTDVLSDIAGITARPQRSNPGAVRGGYISGAMRRKDVRALPESERAAIRKGVGRAVDLGINAGSAAEKKLKWRYNPITGKFELVEELDYDDVEDLPDDAEIPEATSLASGLSKDGISALQDAIDDIYDRLGL